MKVENMTRDEILTLKAGREFDALVAKAMGKNLRIYDCPHPPMVFCTCPIMPYYSTKLEDAWTINNENWLWTFVEREKTLGAYIWRKQVKRGQNPNPPGAYIEEPWHGSDERTYCVARCRVALLMEATDAG